MEEDNLLDDLNFEEASTRELLDVAGSLSKWLRPMATISVLVTIVLLIASANLLLSDFSDWNDIVAGLFTIALAAAWGNAARWQFKFMQWTYRASTHQTSYDQEHWVYLNYRLWQWLAISLIASFVLLIFLSLLGV